MMGKVVWFKHTKTLGLAQVKNVVKVNESANIIILPSPPH